MTMSKKALILFFSFLGACAPVCTVPVEVTHAQCCDGTRANCTGSGCCSHHGGVCYVTRTEERPVQCPEMSLPRATPVGAPVQRTAELPDSSSSDSSRPQMADSSAVDSSSPLTVDSGVFRDVGNVSDTSVVLDASVTVDTGVRVEPDASVVSIESGVSDSSVPAEASLDFSCTLSNQCPLGSRCISGTCELFMRNFTPSPPTNCGGRWVNTNIDTANCGGCGNSCRSNQSCQSGMCTTCGAIYGFNWNECGGACVDYSYDANNCGGCGSRCPMGQVCYMGQCFR